jgi:anti-sigma B factor antagonist
MYENPHGDFELAILQRGRRDASVVLSGELDLASAPELEECLAWLELAGIVNIVLDLTNLTFIESTGISVVVLARKRADEAGGSLIVRNASAQVHKSFEITGLVDDLSVTGVPQAPVVMPLPSSNPAAVSEGSVICPQ